MIAELIFYGMILGFAGLTAFALAQLRDFPSLPLLGNGDASSAKCSVIIAARDEQARIEKTIRLLLAQRRVVLEIIVVDDRSRDQTPEILRRLAVDDNRVKVLRVDTLPDGWLGKCHACYLGAAAATGDWILFTDADCWFREDVIARAIQAAEAARADHITISPGAVTESNPRRAWHLMFIVSCLGGFAGVNRDRPKAYMGMGAFNLVKAAAYRECGGYEALRLTVLDDVKLGLLLRRAGKRTRAFLATHDVECDWGRTVRGMVKIMEKNFFPGLDFRIEAVAFACGVGALTIGTALAGLVSGTWLGLAAAFSPLMLIAPAGTLARRADWPLASALLVPFMFPVMLYAMLNSTVVTLRQGGVRWRDTFYSMRTLREGGVR